MAKGKKGKRAYKGTAMSRRKGKKRKSETGGRDWAALPDGIVDCIADLLLAEDVTEYIHFRCVCASWRRATLDPVVTDCRFRPRNWILISEENQQPDCRFLNLSTGKYIRAHVPELSPDRRHTLLCVAEGFLFFIDNASTVLHLLNPFTGALTRLPPLHLVVVYDRFCSHKPRDFVRVIRKFVHNVNLSPSSPPSSTVVIVSFSYTLAYAKPGDTEWSFTSLKRISLIQSFEDRLYSLCVVKGELLQFEPDQNRFTTLHPSLSDPTLWSPHNVTWAENYHLVLSDGGELLVACRYQLGSSYFKVFKVDLENGTLIPKKSIGERALFICFGRKAFLVSTSTFPSIVPNSIYFTSAFGTYIYHPTGCACHPQYRFLNSAGPSSWIHVCPPRTSLVNCLNLYCTTY